MGFFDRVKDALTGADRARREREQESGAEQAPRASVERAPAEAAAGGPTPAGTTGPVAGDVAQAAVEESAGREAGPGPASDDAGTHTVVRGDTLAAVAERHGVDRDRLAEANGIDNPDLIYPGQVLRLPRD
ncbi:hypothetical protein GCM10009584_09290 [Ornithinimicrobium humiphilum]|uniref:LysM peptidoglycan-binding domain-containing protein n=1 Tax=Ornithinimicrobium humiphilum TaxID=125288 RepID=UPI00192DACD7|nr:LysM peptidoglycan-binding domain-containing protein [Ornithinimicrobium humiphilum]